MSFSRCFEYIESLPSVDHPELFGMQSNANSLFEKSEAKQLLADLLLVHPQIDKDVGWVLYYMLFKKFEPFFMLYITHPY